MSNPSFGREQKEYSAFKVRCQNVGVWDKFVVQHSAIKAAGYKDFETRRLLMPVWDGFLSWMEAGNSRTHWDFEKFRPINSGDAGAFEAFDITITRTTTINKILVEDRVRKEVHAKAGNTKDGPIITDDSMELGTVGGIKLRTPNSTTSRSGEVDWAYENLFEYTSLLEEKKQDKAKYLMEGAPTLGACSWLQYASTNPTKFMTDLAKNSPPDEGPDEDAISAEARYDEVLSMMEKEFKVICPTCSSKF